MKLTVPTLLSFAAGYTDTAGFLAMHGLFTAHVTGNFVTIGAALVMGATGIATKLLALPTFCAAVILVRLLRYRPPPGPPGKAPSKSHLHKASLHQSSAILRVRSRVLSEFRSSSGSGRSGPLEDVPSHSINARPSLLSASTIAFAPAKSA